MEMKKENTKVRRERDDFEKAEKVKLFSAIALGVVGVLGIIAGFIFANKKK